MEKVIIYGSLTNCDGASYVTWYLTEKEALRHQEEQYESNGEECVDEVETFIGSNIYIKAVVNED